MCAWSWARPLKISLVVIVALCVTGCSSTEEEVPSASAASVTSPSNSVSSDASASAPVQPDMRELPPE